MLQNQFLPEVDELPVSWMNRLAIQNGFNDINDMLNSLGFIKGEETIRHHDYMYRVYDELIDHNEWSNLIFDMYKDEDERQVDIIPKMDDPCLYVCPECMKEDMKKHGLIYYHYQHQYLGCYSCWKHKCNLWQVKSEDRFKMIPEKMEFIPIIGSYLVGREMQMFRTCFSLRSFYYRIICYKMDTLMKDQNVSVDDIRKIFRTEYIPDELVSLLQRIVIRNKHRFLTTQEMKLTLQILFDDYQKYQHFFNKVNEELMQGFEFKKLYSGHYMMHIKYKNQQMMSFNERRSIYECKSKRYKTKGKKGTGKGKNISSLASNKRSK